MVPFGNAHYSGLPGFIATPVQAGALKEALKVVALCCGPYDDTSGCGLQDIFDVGYQIAGHGMSQNSENFYDRVASSDCCGDI